MCRLANEGDLRGKVAGAECGVRAEDGGRERDVKDGAGGAQRVLQARVAAALERQHVRAARNKDARDRAAAVATLSHALAPRKGMGLGWKKEKRKGKKEGKKRRKKKQRQSHNTQRKQNKTKKK